MSIAQGTYQFGVCVGTSMEEWHSKGKSGTNYRVGISRQIVGQFGETQDVVEAIDINQDDFERITQQAKMLKGKPVYIQVIASAHARDHRNTNHKHRAPKGSNLFPFNPASAVPAAKVG